MDNEALLVTHLFIIAPASVKSTTARYPLETKGKSHFRAVPFFFPPPPPGCSRKSGIKSLWSGYFTVSQRGQSGGRLRRRSAPFLLLFHARYR